MDGHDAGVGDLLLFLGAYFALIGVFVAASNAATARLWEISPTTAERLGSFLLPGRGSGRFLLGLQFLRVGDRRLTCLCVTMLLSVAAAATSMVALWVMKLKA